MESVRVVGRFMTEDGEPINGRICFLPDDLWVAYQGVPYAILGADQALQSGKFDVELTPGAKYVVISPIGKWPIKVTYSNEPVFLKDMLPSQFQ